MFELISARVQTRRSALLEDRCSPGYQYGSDGVATPASFHLPLSNGEFDVFTGVDDLTSPFSVEA